MSELKTLMQVLDAAVEKAGAHVALRVKKKGTWESITWRGYRDECRKVAKALLACGVRKTEGVAIIGYNCPEWVFADVGAILAGAMPAGIYTTSSPEQCQYITHHCDARVAFAENEAHAKKFVAVKDKLPKLEWVVQMHGYSSDKTGLVIAWDDFIEKGKDIPDSELDARIASQKPDDVCTLIYTSGTTGDPKAVMLSHANVTWTAEAAMSTLDFKPDDVGVSYLPLSHIAEQMLTIHAPMAGGLTVAFSESLEKVGEALAEVRPHMFVGVPRVWEKIQARMIAAASNAPPLRKKIAAWARGVGLEAGYADQQGRSRPLMYGLANKLVFSKVRQRLGLDRARIMVSSAAPISKDTLEFFLSLGMPIVEVYGMSECTGPTTYATWTHYRTGWVGTKIPGTDLKIADDGEICFRGPHVFKGYLKNEAATKEAIDAEGWLHSGDIGEIDKDGFLRITDRKKELLITAGGENVAPQAVEGQLKSIPIVAQAVALGDRQRYIAALVTLDPEQIAGFAAACGSPAKTPAEAAICATFKSALEKHVETANEKLARVQRVRKFAILPNELTIDGGELTPTMKLKRRVIAEKYATQIAELFAEAG
jgi:long-subunit acyl-CoA synthetase (AMP-forming)